MTSLATSHHVVAALGHVPAAPRLLRLRALVRRMADASRAGAARREMTGMSDHRLRDLGLVRGDLDRV